MVQVSAWTILMYSPETVDYNFRKDEIEKIKIEFLLPISSKPKKDLLELI